MRERPIIFSAPMVRAILEGRKMQTRRVAKQFYKYNFDPDAIHKIGPGEFIAWEGKQIPDEQFTRSVYHPGSGIVCPYGQPGDLLWVRETWARQLDGNYIYRAGLPKGFIADYTATGAWKPSIHMPREASRILLEITDVRVERLNDISEADAIAEGLCIVEEQGLFFKDYLDPFHLYRNPVNSFCSLWRAINGPDSWIKNPFVWVITFKKL